jgi:dipeptidyl aminopeptidase/acylaminoacyl peptidase
MRLLFFLFFVFFISQIFAHSEVTHDFISYSKSNKKIEVFWSAPKGNGPWPVLLMIHPHQEWPNKIGARAFVESESLQHWSEKGWLTVALSQPGYGGSDGPTDFCGPLSMEAVAEVVKHIRAMPNIKKDKIFLYGGSRGAVLAALTATQDTKLAGVILRSGLYDFTDAYKNYSWFNPIKWTMLWEIGWSHEVSLRERSAIFYADKIKSPLLILHGRDDDRAPLKYATMLTDKVKKSGIPVTLVVLDAEHIINKEKISNYMENFLVSRLNE